MKDPRTDEEKRQNIPVIPPVQVPDKKPNPVVAVCGACGLRIHKVMGYCCPHPDCPTGFGSVTCHNSDFAHYEGEFVAEGNPETSETFSE